MSSSGKCGRKDDRSSESYFCVPGLYAEEFRYNDERTGGFQPVDEYAWSADF